jgi:hypothetical protein
MILLLAIWLGLVSSFYNARLVQGSSDMKIFVFSTSFVALFWLYLMAPWVMIIQLVWGVIFFGLPKINFSRLTKSR